VDSRPAHATAPELSIARWFNSGPLTLASLRGRIVVLHAFQMLCPGCVQHGTPQTQRLFEQFDPADVAVIGLHTVFENHDVMTPRALEVFIHENRLSFPIGVDEPDGTGIPRTMSAYGMRGTPTFIAIDRQGRLRDHRFGQVPDLYAGAVVGRLVGEQS
jgi:peroxiredoxin